MHALLLLLLTSPVRAQDALEETAELTAPEQALEHALDAYLRGDLRGARDVLLRVVNDPALEDEEVLQSARAWLGEIYWNMGDREAARSTFRTVLLYDRDYRLDPFQHPPDVVAFYDSVRAEIDAASAPEPLARRDLPAPSAYLWPGGVQLHNDKPLAAALTTVGVAASAGGVAGLRVFLVRQDQDPNTYGIQVPEARAESLSQVRAGQWAIAAAGMGLWLGTSVGGTVVAARPTLTAVGPGMVVRF
ncbi:MAG: hypothetical protein GY913_19590 [Proteobacteria bacterium]|nr:hypothetical protein [Pseudomonadota bacterium]MCP4919113.1 hypothetical protein [Pseudomonadota bacterium]